MELSKKISDHNYKAFLWHAVFLALAVNFMDVDTIIPAMMVDAGGTSFQLGILTTIMLGGGRLSQLFFALHLNNQSLKKPWLLLGINTRIATLTGMALLFYFSKGLSSLLIIWSIFILISLFSLSGGFANINYTDILGKSILSEKRKSFFSIRQIISSVLVFLSAFLARFVLTEFGYPVNYAALFLIAAVLLGSASAGFWMIRETPAPVSRIEGLSQFMRIVVREIRSNPRLKHYLLLTNTQGISMVLMPFLILYAKQTFEAGSGEIGTYLILKVVGGVLTGSLIFYFAERSKYQNMLYITSALSILIPGALLLLPGSALFPYIFLFGGIIFTLHHIATNGILLEFTTNENRALYTGLSGAGAVLPVIFPFISGWMIEQSGFQPFFILFILILLLSFVSVKKFNCKI